tara:strand:- start:887 stop:1291 length:405 start_codon:yes stop_codon:yes gene_type:complete
MRNFKNNFRRSRYKNHSDRNNHKNENGKIINDLQNGSNFIRKNAGRNNHNASRLIEKYSDLAREALTSGDKILSENYFQHVEHFVRIREERDAQFNKDQIPKEIVKVKEKTDQDQKNTNNIDSESLEPTASTES